MERFAAIVIQLIFTCSTSKIETLEKLAKYVQKLSSIKTPERIQ